MDISVVIPAYNRLDLLKHSIRSVLAAARASPALRVECVVADDGSNPPLAGSLTDVAAGFPADTFRIVRHQNAGSAAARLLGLHAVRGEYVQFLDSDDLIHPEKLATHVRVMRDQGAELSYSDVAITPTYDLLNGESSPPIRSRQTFPSVQNPAELFIGVQIPSHAPVFRRDALLAALADPIIPLNQVVEPAGDTWLFFNCASQSWRVAKVDGYYAVYVHHDDERHSTKWEKTAVSALGIMLVFALRCPVTPNTLAARKALGVAAFQGYRRLPLRFHSEYERLMLALFQTAPRGTPLSRLGGSMFAALARVVGPPLAARLLRTIQCRSYATYQMISRSELDGLFEAMVTHVRNVCGTAVFDERFGS